jgi:exopolyphosphatase / guanosine-5'-triphosphate,3'-diphosphate pyrophosphatase
MISAIIDCGTNTFNLLIVEHNSKGTYKVLLNTKKCVKLGEGGLVNNKIAPKPFDRGIKTFFEMVETAARYEAQNIHAFATSAIRSSVNGPDFVKTVYDKSGIMIQVLNGDTEAQYIYKGVRLALEDFPEPILIMDIGGGSTEFIIAQGSKVLWKKSFDLGAARLLMEFLPSDPITMEEIEKLITHLKTELQPLSAQLKKHQVKYLIGCSGTFESLADIIRADNHISDPVEKLFHFEEKDFITTYKKLISSSEEQRKLIPGLIDFRVDTIVYGSIFVKFVKKRFKIPHMAYSSYSLKEGVLYDLIHETVVIN